MLPHPLRPTLPQLLLPLVPLLLTLLQLLVQPQPMLLTQLLMPPPPLARPLLMLLTQLLTLLLTPLKLLPLLLPPSNHWLLKKSRLKGRLFYYVMKCTAQESSKPRGNRSNLNPAEAFFLACYRPLHQFAMTCAAQRRIRQLRQ